MFLVFMGICINSQNLLTNWAKLLVCYQNYGAKRARTADPLHAMQVLYQLSYSPESQSFIVLKTVAFVKGSEKIEQEPIHPARWC